MASTIETEQQGEESVIHIETVDLSPRGVTLPSDGVGMVIAQPYVSLTATEPYQCIVAAKERQLAVLTDTLAVARAAPHCAPKTHFTVFPEYTIPGLDGVAQVETALRDPGWPNGTIVIGGTDALTKADFGTLAGAEGTHLNKTHNGLDRIAQNEWINCAVIWVKAANGTVERWLQPKLDPAWLERDVPYQNMFRGHSVFTFKGPLENGTQYRFCSLVCYDWIARMQDKKAWQWVVEDLARQAAQAEAELSLSWLFVIQHNRRPSDDAFLTEVSSFFDQTTLPNVRRDRACLVFANSAGSKAPGRADLYGSTSLVFSRQTLFAEPKCHPTFSNGGQRFRTGSATSRAYFDPAHWVERWRFTDAPADAPEFVVPRFDRTLSEYLNAVVDGGFVLRQVAEPRPSEDYCEAHPSQRGWRDHAALFLYVRAEKGPASLRV